MSLLQRFFGPKVPRLEEQGDIDGLIAVVESDVGDDTRIAALEALARLGDDRAVAALVAALGDASVNVAGAAETAVRALGPAAAEVLVVGLGGDLGDRVLAVLTDLKGAAVEPLRGATSAPDQQARLRALTGLLELEGRLEEPEVRETVFRTLLASLGDRSPVCRIVAASGLENLGDARAGRALAAQLKDGDEGVRTACFRALRMIGEPAVPYLVDALADRNSNSRRLAAELLGEVCGAHAETEDRREALAALVLRVEDRDADVSGAVLGALEAIPSAEVIAEQLELLADPERSDRDEILSFLTQLIDNASVDPDQRTAAVERIRSLGFTTEG